MPDIVNYTPPPTIRRFMLSDAPARFLMGPVGSGKSSGSIIEIARRARQQEPNTDGTRHTRGFVVRNTYKQLKRTTIKTFKQWFPPNRAGIWRETELTFGLRISDVECEVMFLALDTSDDVANLLSLEGTFMYLNECREIDPEVMKAIVSTKRLGRYPSKKDGLGASWWGLWGDTDAPTQGTWWYHMLEGLNPDSEEHEPLPNSWEVFKQPSGRSPEAENVENLPEGYYDTTDMTEDDIRVYVDGEYGLSKGGRAVWPLFHKQIHVAKMKLNPVVHLPVVIGLDPGRTGACVFKQQNMSGQVMLLDECISEDMGANRFLNEKVHPLINARYAGLKLLVAMDPSGNSKAQTEERSVADVWRKHGFVVKPAASNNLEPRLSAVDHFLSRRTAVGEALLVSPHCRRVIDAMSGGYRYKINKGGVVNDEPLKNNASHPADAVQYGCMRFVNGNLAAAQVLRPQSTVRAMPRTQHRPADLRTGY